MRIFVAIDMPENVQDALEALQDQIPVGRLMTPETLHLTLAFLDEQPDAMVEAIHEALQTLHQPKFDLNLHGLGTFGPKSPAVLWAGVRPNPALNQLRDKIRSAARLAGLDLPRERFRPHVTLARFNPRIPAEQLERLRIFLSRFGDAALPTFTVAQITLFQSLRTSHGAVHEALAEYPLS